VSALIGEERRSASDRGLVTLLLSARREPAGRGEREVREDCVGAGALESGQRLEHARALVEPAVLRAAFSIAYSPDTW
jgi:hypothetical protein